MLIKKRKTDGDLFWLMFHVWCLGESVYMYIYVSQTGSIVI